MKKTIFLKLACYVLFMMPFMTMAEPKEEQRKILPHIEAEKIVNTFFSSASIAWLDSENIIYSFKSNDYKADDKQESIDIDSTKTVQVGFFNVSKKITEPYKAGEFLEYKDGNITILLSISNGKVPYNERHRLLLKGPLGNEQEEKYFSSKQPKPPRKCPSDIEEKQYIPIFLKPEHGCIRAPTKSGTIKQWLYFRTDGKNITLDEIPSGSFMQTAHWIDWLGIYILGDNVSMEITRTNGPAINTPTVILLSPEGKVKVIDMGIFGLQHTRPTRAGMVAEARGFYNGAFIRATNGLRLWRDGQIYHIATGEVMTAEVSPDGCKVAYVVQLDKELLVRGRKSRLRVIDVCKAFGVAEDANPF